MGNEGVKGGRGSGYGGELWIGGENLLAKVKRRRATNGVSIRWMCLLSHYGGCASQIIIWCEDSEVI